MKEAGSARVARASLATISSRWARERSRKKTARSDVGGWTVTKHNESRDIQVHERDVPPATGGGGTLGAHQGLSRPSGGAGAHRWRRCATETEAAVRKCAFFETSPKFAEKLVLVRRASSIVATRVPRAADVDRDGVGGSVTVPRVRTRGVPTPGAGVPCVAARPGTPRDRRGACLPVSGISRRVLRVRGPVAVPHMQA